MALWISESVRRRFGLEDLLPSAGRSPVGDVVAFRRLAGRLSQPRPDRAEVPAVSAGELMALSAIEAEASRLLDRQGVDWEETAETLRRRFGDVTVRGALDRFSTAFGVDQASRGPDGALLRHLTLLWALERHPAGGRLAAILQEGRPAPEPLFAALPTTAGGRALAALGDWMAVAPPGLGAAVRDLAARTRPEEEPAAGRERRERALLAADVLAEENRPGFVPPGAAGADAVEEPVASWEPTVGAARYGRDPEWALELVLVAKQLPVWLHQLGVERLDQVPDGELDRLASLGFTGLWLVGLWQRSRASQWIKQLCGNPQAAASAYSIAAYTVAEELGGDGALDALRQRASRYGLRLAADMVPNHMGIDSPWVLEHPERFLSLPEPPFPSYSFSGPDLSPRPADVRLFLEDHYYEASDAAVVFEHLDRADGRRRYLYHGNDGTGLPWNDTAQLDYRRADVREAVLDTIVEVARRFPVIRFDAAMTLAWKHFRRLWFPAPGEGGAIPSRSGHGVSERALREAMPREFWAEVVDRVEREAPDTLLLAEAFWLMEAHFARDLGLHRVYNSAFVNCLRHDRPAELRRQIAEVLRLDPRLLERQVNYLSNPDEAPVRAVFGDGARWQAVSVLLATLPGTPLFAHGQAEGLTERYGMEYRRAYHDESADPEVEAWHRRVLAPLLARRRHLAGSASFRLLELRQRDGTPAQEVVAFANGRGPDLHVVVVNLGAREVRGELVPAEGPNAGGDSPADRTVPGSGRGPGAGPSRCRAGQECSCAWEALVLSDFEARADPPGEDAGPRRSVASRTTVGRRRAVGREGSAPACTRTPPGRAVPLAAAVLLGVGTLVGLERWLAGATGTAAGLLIAASPAGSLLGLRLSRRT
ncbi:MAG: alpha-amylase family glycosyl hydrolase [Thermoanaerobaculia bacterium]